MPYFTSRQPTPSKQPERPSLQSARIPETEARTYPYLTVGHGTRILCSVNNYRPNNLDSSKFVRANNLFYEPYDVYPFTLADKQPYAPETIAVLSVTSTLTSANNMFIYSVLPGLDSDDYLPVGTWADRDERIIHATTKLYFTGPERWLPINEFLRPTYRRWFKRRQNVSEAYVKRLVRGVPVISKVQLLALSAATDRSVYPQVQLAADMRSKAALVNGSFSLLPDYLMVRP